MKKVNNSEIGREELLKHQYKSVNVLNQIMDNETIVLISNILLENCLDDANI